MYYNNKVSIYERTAGYQNSTNIRKYSGKTKLNTKVSLRVVKKNLVSKKLKNTSPFLKKRTLGNIAKHALGLSNTKKLNYLKKFQFSRLNLYNAGMQKILSSKTLKLPNISDTYKINSLYLKLIRLYKFTRLKTTSFNIELFKKALNSSKYTVHPSPINSCYNSNMLKILV